MNDRNDPRAWRRFGTAPQPAQAQGGTADAGAEPSPAVAGRASGADETDSGAARREAHEWAQTVARLLKSVDAHHAGITTARKREGLMRALLVREPDPTALMQKLNRLVDSWMLNGSGHEALAGLETVPYVPTDTLASTSPLVTAANAARVAPEASGGPLDTTILGLEARAAAQPNPAVTNKLRDLLALLLRSIAELTPEHAMLAQQVEQINAVLSLPLNERRIDEAERQLRGLMIKQGAIRHSIEEAKNAIKEMVATLIARLSAVSDSAGGYYQKIETYSAHIQRADNIGELSEIVRGLLDDTRVVSVDMARARDDLVYAKQKVHEHELRVESLERELAKVSQLIRTDPLTETLNRRGFEEAYSVEIARAMRHGDAITVGMLDVDDFKQLNDRHGHQAGDTALRYLADVLRETLRPDDAIGRYGGEEFAILLPGVSAMGAATIMTRVQRELTRRIFMHNNEKILITFSAGIAQVRPVEGLASALEQADHAMYEAKRTGKNRVRIAPGSA